MNFIKIFAEHLYVIRYGDQPDELTRIFGNWKNTEYLFDFFKDEHSMLNFFDLSMAEAVSQTTKEAYALQRSIIKTGKNNPKNLSLLFENLDNKEFGEYMLSMQKHKHRWLRIYAIRVDTYTFLITGGAIKTSHEMSEKPHTQEELNKLNKCKAYLNENGVFDLDSFKELLNETL